MATAHSASAVSAWTVTKKFRMAASDAVLPGLRRRRSCSLIGKSHVRLSDSCFWNAAPLPVVLLPGERLGTDSRGPEVDMLMPSMLTKISNTFTFPAPHDFVVLALEQDSLLRHPVALLVLLLGNGARLARRVERHALPA